MIKDRVLIKMIISYMDDRIKDAQETKELMEKELEEEESRENRGEDKITNLKMMISHLNDTIKAPQIIKELIEEEIKEYYEKRKHK